MHHGAYEYDGKFFAYVDRGAIRSARVVVPTVIDALGCRSVLDVGCGTGAWLSVYRDCGISDVTGVDGDYVDRARLMISGERFHAIDVSRAFNLNKTFDLVQSLEVAEHLPPETSRVFVANLVRHGAVVLFSAAVPGQGGENHVNERPYEFWRGLFAEYGYAPYDFLRPQLRDHHEVEAWYRYNSMLYVREDRAASLSVEVTRTRIASGSPIQNSAPMSFRMRTMLLRMCPVAVVTKLAALRHRLVLARSQSEQA
jgi:SAM-dependent methyltransferase